MLPPASTGPLEAIIVIVAPLLIAMSKAPSNLLTLIDYLATFIFTYFTGSLAIAPLVFLVILKASIYLLSPFACLITPKMGYWLLLEYAPPFKTAMSKLLRSEKHRDLEIAVCDMSIYAIVFGMCHGWLLEFEACGCHGPTFSGGLLGILWISAFLVIAEIFIAAVYFMHEHFPAKNSGNGDTPANDKKADEKTTGTTNGANANTSMEANGDGLTLLKDKLDSLTALTSRIDGLSSLKEKLDSLEKTLGTHIESIAELNVPYNAFKNDIGKPESTPDRSVFSGTVSSGKSTTKELETLDQLRERCTAIDENLKKLDIQAAQVIERYKSQAQDETDLDIISDLDIIDGDSEEGVLTPSESE
jgi:archaellum component FlaC